MELTPWIGRNFPTEPVVTQSTMTRHNSNTRWPPGDSRWTGPAQQGPWVSSAVTAPTAPPRAPSLPQRPQQCLTPPSSTHRPRFSLPSLRGDPEPAVLAPVSSAWPPTVGPGSASWPPRRARRTLRPCTWLLGCGCLEGTGPGTWTDLSQACLEEFQSAGLSPTTTRAFQFAYTLTILKIESSRDKKSQGLGPTEHLVCLPPPHH